MGQKLVFDESGESHTQTVVATDLGAEQVPKKRNSEQKRMNLRQKKVKQEQEYHNRQYGPVDQNINESAVDKESKVAKGPPQKPENSKEYAEESVTPEETNEKEESVKDKKARLAAIDYLNTFIHDKSNWKFQKVRQIWILQNLYYQHQLDNEQFKHALQYIKGMGQRAKEETINEAKELLNVEEGTIKKRAKKIIKLL